MSSLFRGHSVVFYLLAGILLVGWESYSAVLSFQSRSWNTATGTVTKSKLERRHRSRGRSSWHPVVEYRYRVKGKTHESTRTHFGDLSSFSSLFSWDGNGVIERYPKGKSVKVYYNPNNPTQAVLEQDLGLSTYVIIGVGLLLCGFSTYSLVGNDDIIPSPKPDFESGNPSTDDSFDIHDTDPHLD
jgi:hypothetical protein